MSVTINYTKCCRPLGGGKCSKSLRNVLPWMQQKNPTLNLNQKICDSCRKALSLRIDYTDSDELLGVFVVSKVPVYVGRYPL